MAMKDNATQDRLDNLMYHYQKGTQDMDTRRIRVNGWNDIISAYMGKLPSNWPYLARVTDPRIRTAIVEKSARIINAKLQGRVVPREGGDVLKARIQNAILDYQWDAAQKGGSMIEKIALGDQMTRIFGSAFVQVYWDVKKNTNEIKVIDPRDIFFDPAATHVQNAKWVQVREFTTADQLEERGYDMAQFYKLLKGGKISNDPKSTSYISIVRSNRGLDDRIGEFDDPNNPTVEVVTQWTNERCEVFLPRHAILLDNTNNPYDHKKIPIAQLRYYPLVDDIFGESEVECAMPLQKAINQFLCAHLDESNIRLRPPLKVASTGVRIDTIEYGPGAMWIMQRPDLVQQMEFSQASIASFNQTYPMLVAAFNTAMGDNSLGVSNTKGSFSEKTATEVKALAVQQNSRDQSNQIYLSEFLKDIVVMWMSNTKQYLFDDPKKHYIVLKIVGKDNIKNFLQMGLQNNDIQKEHMLELGQTITDAGSLISPEELSKVGNEIQSPQYPVILNPDEKNPENYMIKNKLDVVRQNQEADLYVTKDDFEGIYDYIPDVKSMAAGAGEMMKDARMKVLEMALNPQVNQMLAQQGETLNLKEVLVDGFEDAGYRDAESLFEKAQENNVSLMNGQSALPAGPTAPQAGPVAPGNPSVGGIPAIPQAISSPVGAGGISQPQGIQF